MTRTRSAQVRYIPRVVALEDRAVPSFLPPAGYAAGTGPNEPALADFNGDGLLDIAVSVGGNVAILRGRGNGAFAPPTLYPADSPVGLKAADLNADGRIDVVTANVDHTTIGVLLGNGDGSFQPQMSFRAGRRPFNLDVGDLNGDGRLDVAVSNLTGGLAQGPFASVLFGNGDGSFQAPVLHYAGSGSFSVAIGDLDRDGIGDLSVTTFYDSWVRVFLSSGGNTTYPTGASPTGHVQADVNRDGHPDLIVARISGSVSVLLNRGDGTFNPKTDNAVFEDPRYVAVADVNQDGNPDVAALPFWGSAVSVLLGNGDGTFGLHTEYPVGGGAKITAGDLNGDGYPDLETGGSANTGNKVIVLMNDSNWPPPIAPPGDTIQEAEAAATHANRLDRPRQISESTNEPMEAEQGHRRWPTPHVSRPSGEPNKAVSVLDLTPELHLLAVQLFQHL